MTTPPAPPAPPGRGGGVTAWVKAHKAEAAGIGLALVLGVIVIVKRSSSAGTAATTSTTGTTADPNAVTAPGTYGYGSGTYGGYAGDMSGLQSGLSGGTVAGLPTSTTAGVDSSTGSAAATSAATGGTTGPADTSTSSPAPSSSSGSSTVSKVAAAVKQIWVPAQTITVGKGQTLMSLSQQYLGTTNRTQLAHSNNLGTGAGLHTGQKLTVPGHYRTV